jgi:hypothetical protein
MNPEDIKLQELLRESRPAPSLPPRFQENVWRRIEDAEAPMKSESWIEALASLILRPRLAFAAIALLAVAGILLGALEGAQTAKRDAQARYVAYVAPNSLH